MYIWWLGPNLRGPLVLGPPVWRPPVWRPPVWVVWGPLTLPDQVLEDGFWKPKDFLEVCFITTTTITWLPTPRRGLQSLGHVKKDYNVFFLNFFSSYSIHMVLLKQMIAVRQKFRICSLGSLSKMENKHFATQKYYVFTLSLFQIFGNRIQMIINYSF